MPEDTTLKLAAAALVVPAYHKGDQVILHGYPDDPQKIRFADLPISSRKPGEDLHSAVLWRARDLKSFGDEDILALRKLGGQAFDHQVSLGGVRDGLRDPKSYKLPERFLEQARANRVIVPVAKLQAPSPGVEQFVTKTGKINSVGHDIEEFGFGIAGNILSNCSGGWGNMAMNFLPLALGAVVAMPFFLIGVAGGIVAAVSGGVGAVKNMSSVLMPTDDKVRRDFISAMEQATKRENGPALPTAPRANAASPSPSA